MKSSPFTFSNISHSNISAELIFRSDYCKDMEAVDDGRDGASITTSTDDMDGDDVNPNTSKGNNYASPSTSKDTSSKHTVKRRDDRFTPRHLALIKKVFRANITKKKKPNLAVIENKRQELEDIYAYEGYDPQTVTKKIYESVRSQIRLRQ